MRKRYVVTIVALLMSLASGLLGEEYRLPDPAEVATYSPEGMGFYMAGMKSLDKVDYVNAYNQLAKAAQLAPSAVRLNMIVAGLAIKHGRSKPAAEARGYYETAVIGYNNVLRQKGLEEAFRRDVKNRLKMALEERNTLAQRDARREAIGTKFVGEIAREYGGLEATPRPGAVAPGMPATPAASTLSLMQSITGASRPAGAGAPGAPGAPAAPPVAAPGVPPAPAGAPAPGAEPAI